MLTTYSSLFWHGQDFSGQQYLKAKDGMSAKSPSTLFVWTKKYVESLNVICPFTSKNFFIGSTLTSLFQNKTMSVFVTKHGCKNTHLWNIFVNFSFHFIIYFISCWWMFHKTSGVYLLDNNNKVPCLLPFSQEFLNKKKVNKTILKNDTEVSFV